MRKRNNLLCSCKEEAIISFQHPEEIEKQKRRNAFMKSNCQTAELFLFSISLKKQYEQLDKLIAKYSGEEMEYLHHNMNCPLCDLFYVNPLDKKRNRGNCCKSCPNMYFFIKVYKEQERIIGCDKRKNKYPQLNYLNNNNYPTLKQFWTDYKSLYLQRIYTNSEIMEILIKPFKEEQK